MIKHFPPLYGVSSKGAIKVWKISVQKNSHLNSDLPLIIIEHGQFGGKMQTATEKIREGKNIGKSNETTPFEQACSEAQSKWTKQHDKNYTETMPTGGQTEAPKLLPMLAQKYKERQQKLVWPGYAQPKLNGVRCLVKRTGGTITYSSRKAKQYKNFNLYMDQEFLSIMQDGDILDGEMYNHGDLTFQELISLIKDEKTPDLESLKKYVHFWNYDRPDGDKGFRQRFVEQHPENESCDFKYIRIVQTVVVRHDADVQEFHRGWVQEGYEGTIVRSGGDEPYCFQYRNDQLQKYKDFIDKEFKIVGCKEGKGKDEGKAIFRCQSDSRTGGEYGDGTFDVRCKGAGKIRIEQWNNYQSYIGKELTVRYQSLSDSGIPIILVGIAVRDYE